MPARVSAVVPARNEQANIRACVESLLAQAEALEVLVADDGSTDGTAAIVSELARRDPRVRLVTVPPLPPGWVGKNHALGAAARCARGDWLLFTDADTLHASLQRAERDGLHLLSLSPVQETVTWWEKGIIPRVYRELESLFRYEETNDPKARAAAANGQYILIRRATYEALGGHASVRAEILEDVALARAVKQAGGRLHFSSGAGVVRTRMYRNFKELREGWTKNLFLLYGRRAHRLLGAVAGIWVLDILPVALLAWTPLPAAAWIGLRHLAYALRLRRAGEGPRLAFYYWPGSLLFSFLLLNSLARHALGLPLAWRGRQYGMDSLTIGTLMMEKMPEQSSMIQSIHVPSL